MKIPLYQLPRIYELSMKLLYGNDFELRVQLISQFIAPGQSVLEICAGTCQLVKYLPEKSRYLALDESAQFVSRARKHGIPAQIFDLREEPVPKEYDVLVLQASLYQFYPNHERILQKILTAARSRVIIAEPINTWTHSSQAWKRFLAQILARSYPKNFRFTQEALDAWLGPMSQIQAITPGGQEKLYILQK